MNIILLRSNNERTAGPFICRLKENRNGIGIPVNSFSITLLGDF